MKNLLALIALVVSIVALALSFSSARTTEMLGGISTILETFSAGVQIGDQGTAVTNVLAGTCNPTFSGTSLAATSTGQFFCTVTGARSGDQVIVTLPNTARTAANATFSVSTGYATTSDRIGFDITNMTGAATTSFAQATTSVKYLILRTSTNP